MTLSRRGSKPRKQAIRSWVWILIVTSLVTIFGYFKSDLMGLLVGGAPKFKSLRTNAKPDSIFVVPRNRSADKKKNLDVEFKKFRLTTPPVSGIDYTLWKLNLEEHDLPDSLITAGIYKLAVGFSDRDYSDSITFRLRVNAPYVEAELTRVDSDSNKLKIQGKAISHLQLASDTLVAKLAFHYKGQSQSIPLDVERKIDWQGKIYFEFATTVDGFPRIPPDDPDYSEPFFAMHVSDLAGNSVAQEQSYAQFIAPGNQRFAMNDIADIQIAKLPPDMQSNLVRLSVRIKPKRELKYDLPERIPAILLKAVRLKENINQLEWISNIPEDSLNENQATTVLRNDEQLAITFEDSFKDIEAHSDQESNYRVEQTTRNGITFSSNTAKPLAQTDSLIVSPRDTLTHFSADVSVTANLPQFDTDNVALFYTENKKWKKVFMTRTLIQKKYIHTFLDLKSSMQYYVQTGNDISDIFEVKVDSSFIKKRAQTEPGVVRLEYNFIPGFDLDSLANNELQNFSKAFSEAGITLDATKKYDHALPHWEWPEPGDSTTYFPTDDVALRNYAKRHIDESYRYHVLAVSYAHWNKMYIEQIFGKTIYIGSTSDYKVEEIQDRTAVSFVFCGDILKYQPKKVIPEFAVAVVTHEVGHAMGLTNFSEVSGLHNPQQKYCVMQGSITDIKRPYRLRPFFCFDNDAIQTNSCRDNLQRVLQKQSVDEIIIK